MEPAFKLYLHSSQTSQNTNCFLNVTFKMETAKRTELVPFLCCSYLVRVRGGEVGRLYCGPACPWTASRVHSASTSVSSSMNADELWLTVSITVTEISCVPEHHEIRAVLLIKGEILKIACVGGQECRQTAASAGEKLPVLFANVSFSGETKREKNPKPLNWKYMDLAETVVVYASFRLEDESDELRVCLVVPK